MCSGDGRREPAEIAMSVWPPLEDEQAFIQL